MLPFSKKWLVNFYQLTSHFFDSLKAALVGGFFTYSGMRTGMSNA